MKNVNEIIAYNKLLKYAEEDCDVARICRYRSKLRKLEKKGKVRHKAFIIPKFN